MYHQNATGQEDAAEGSTTPPSHETDITNWQLELFAHRQRESCEEGTKIHHSASARRQDEGDGSRCNGDRDAPGQSCVYIPPGNHRFESYRLATFSQYPRDIPIRTTELAMMGFYYTGYRDRVKCFSCGSCVENFVVGDDAFDNRWHLTSCMMIIGQETSNVPTQMSQLRISFMQITGKQRPSLQLFASNFSRHNIGGEPMDVTEVSGDRRRVQTTERLPELTLANVVDSQHEDSLRSLSLQNEEHRRRTFTKWPSYPCPYLPAELAKDGFFYLGNLDRAQCFSCSGVLRNWAPGDVVREQHLRHFRQCRMANDTDPRNIPMTPQQRQRADEEDRARMASRIPNENTREPPDPSAAEQRHLALYFPCTNAVNPHLQTLQHRLETFERWPRDRTRATPEQMAAAGLFYLGNSDKTKCFYCNGGLQNWEWNDEPWTEHAKWFPGCEFVLRRKGVNFVRTITEMHPNLNRPSIRNAVSYHDVPSHIPSERNYGQASAMEVIEAVGGGREIQVKDGQQEKGAENVQRNVPQRSTSHQSPDPTLVSSLQEIEESLLCRVCKSKQAEAIVLPCAHLCACHDCASSVTRCPVCNHKVKETMKVFRA